MNYYSFDLLDRTLDEVQIFTGFEDSNLEIIEKHFKTKLLIRSHEIKIEENENTESIVLVIQKCFELIDTQRKLHSQDVSYLCTLAKENKLKDFHVDQLRPIGKTRSGKLIYPKTLGQAILCDALRKNDIVFSTGVAGTGKTYLAVAYAVQCLRQEKKQRIILTRPAVEAGESLGFLPGDMKEKVDPYLRPLYDALFQIMGAESFNANMEKGLIEVAPLAYMRGRTLDNAFIILDEAQNTTPAQMKMFLTRIGFGSKVVVTGDQTQKDLPKDVTSGLDVAMKVLSKVDEIGFVKLTNHDVVRHPLVQKIVKAYEEYEERQNRRSDRAERERKIKQEKKGNRRNDS